VKSASSALLTLPRGTTNPSARAKDLEAIYNKWLEVVWTYYNYHHLTYPSDKLPALAGVASEFRKSIGGDTYLAGIWRDDFPRGLLWHMCTEKIGLPGLAECGIFPDDTGPVLQPDRAPSWSWARWDRVILFPVQYSQTVHDEHLVELLDHHIRYRGLNRLGEVIAGTLRLRGWAAKMDLDEIRGLGEVRLDLPQLSDEQSKYIILLVGTFLDHTLHEVPREIWRKGMLLLRPIAPQDGTKTIFERVGAVFNREDTHGAFGLEGGGWRL
jgi:hypothetical protein